MATLLISSPHLVAALLEPKDIGQNIMLIDLYGDIVGNRWQAEIRLIFKAISFSKSDRVERKDFYLGSTGATVVLDLQKNGDFKEWTRGKEMLVESAISKTFKRTFKVEIKPEVEVKKVETKFSAGSVGTNSGKETKEESKYDVHEYPLSDLKIGETVEWCIQLPKGYKAVRDFLYGNVLLTADIEWGSQHRTGTFTLRTSDIRFFDDQREPVTKKKNFAMKYFSRPKINIQNRDGLTFNFEIDV